MAEKEKLTLPPAPPAPTKADTVKMHHPEQANKVADVHPDEVAGWKLHGWREGTPSR